MFLLEYDYAGQSPSVKQQIVDMAMNASGIRDTARVLYVSPTTVTSRAVWHYAFLHQWVGRLQAPHRSRAAHDWQSTYIGLLYERSEESRLSATAVENGTVPDRCPRMGVRCVSWPQLSGGGAPGQPLSPPLPDVLSWPRMGRSLVAAVAGLDGTVGQYVAGLKPAPLHPLPRARV